MEKFTLPNDIEVVYIKAPHFHEDVLATYEKLNQAIPANPNRRYFGISLPDATGTIQYKAAAAILPSDHFSNSDLKQFTIEKGNFSAKYIVNHFQDSNAIPDTFQELLQHPDLDPNGYCLEIYKNYTDVDVHCMVRLK